MTGDKQPKIIAPRQAKAISNLKSDNSLKTLQTFTFISSSLRDISLSFSTNWTSSSVFLLLMLVFFLIISSFLFWVSISSWASWERTKPA